MSVNTVKTPRKLIEVALPLDKINVAAAREKSIRHGHPSTLHLWWARRPLAAARAVIFAQMVNDPGYEQRDGFRRGMNKEKAAIERERLFRIIEELVKWENTNNEAVLKEAREEICKSWRETCELNRKHPQATQLFNPDKLPAFHDPFAGGGALPLEAQRLGLESYASDLNPVAVTINKAMLEIPPKFAGRAPIGPEIATERGSARNATRDGFEDWSGSKGLAEDVRRYGAWMRAEAEKRVGHLYPKVEITSEMVHERTDLKALIGRKLTVIAWLWARTVRSPNPAFQHVDVPLATTFILSKKVGNQSHVEICKDDDKYTFVVRTGTAPKDAGRGTKAPGHGANFLCSLSGVPITAEYIREQGRAGKLGQRLMAIAAEGPRGRVYLSPTATDEQIATTTVPSWSPEVEFFQQALGFRIGNYGFTKWSDLFSARQLFALTTLTDLVAEARQHCLQAVRKAEHDDSGSAMGYSSAYADAIAVYLGIFVSRMVNLNNTFCQWRNDPAKEHVGHLFTRQAVPMVWDFAEANPLCESGGGFQKTLDFVPKIFSFLPRTTQGVVTQANARDQQISSLKVVSTDPPYYDNVGYADLSDFFYVWLRRSLKDIFPEIYATLTAPKADELVATPGRHGGRRQAEAFFREGMSVAVRNLAELAHPAFPVTIFYAFKQAESANETDTHSTGWETFLESVLQAGFAITGTWPMRTELSNRMRSADSNALASSIVLVCRRHDADAPNISRRDFVRELNAALPEALDEMTRGGVNSPVAPVDLSQSIIGPGMSIFSKYSAVLEADGQPMRVKTALQLINRFLAEDDFDHDTQFCLSWFDHQGWAEGAYGEADVLARAKGTSVDGLVEAGVIENPKGKLRLLRWSEMPRDWSPSQDSRTPIWEALHQLIRALNHDGESAAGELLAKMPARAEAIRALAYRLYTLCERKGNAEDARAYNELIASWTGIETAAQEAGHVGAQAELDV